MHIKCEYNWCFSTINYSLVTDTIYISTVHAEAKQGFLCNFGTGTFFKRFHKNTVCQK